SAAARLAAVGGERGGLAAAPSPPKQVVGVFPPGRPKVAVVGAGWGGLGAAKALCENGCEVIMLDGMPDPTGKTPFLTPSGKPFDIGQRGFWKERGLTDCMNTTEGKSCYM
ncbi:unnamed protein product, partial [Prorocentrum cordatum]